MWVIGLVNNGLLLNVIHCYGLLVWVWENMQRRIIICLCIRIWTHWIVMLERLYLLCILLRRECCLFDVVPIFIRFSCSVHEAIPNVENSSFPFAMSAALFMRLYVPSIFFLFILSSYGFFEQSNNTLLLTTSLLKKIFLIVPRRRCDVVCTRLSSKNSDESY